ncbi:MULTISPECIES: hypothetical protein [unclassified Streptomyces]|uniref:hypothetical protein n=1 Tax=unclassified Streptomyces TaxID=2593676 RepID=UPI002E185F34
MSNVTGTLLVLVPQLSGLPEPQACGRCCVWCGAALGSGRSVDLGERNEDGRHWFPRGCPRCTAQEVYRQLMDHTSSCEQCVDDGALCAASADLRRALREGRRG